MVRPCVARELSSRSARWSLLDQLEIPRLPRLIEPRLQRTVQTQHHVPTLSGHRLNPVGFLVGRSFRTEPNRYRPVRIFLEPRRGISTPASFWSVSNKERVSLS